jgi:hypothetical protein
MQHDADNARSGEKQLFCLARVLLKSTSLVVFDEADSKLMSIVKTLSERKVTAAPCRQSGRRSVQHAHRNQPAIAVQQHQNLHIAQVTIVVAFFIVLLLSSAFGAELIPPYHHCHFICQRVCPRPSTLLKTDFVCVLQQVGCCCVCSRCIDAPQTILLLTS